MYKFYLPNFYTSKHKSLNLFWIDLLKERPDFFYDGVEIGAIYGNFPDMIWGGGRIVDIDNNADNSLSGIIETINSFNSRNVPIRYACTNTLITKEHLNDKYANTIIDLSNNGMNEIIVNSLILEDYLRMKYPNFKYISSTTKCLLDRKEVIEEGNKYFLTVLDYRLNKDIDFLSTLKPENYEILIDPTCHEYCPCRAEHYDKVSQIVLNHGQVSDDTNLDGCCYIEGFHNMLKHSEMLITVEELYSTYTNMGFTNFKLEGRNNNVIDVLEAYLYYMVKPEHKDYIRYLATKYAIVGGFYLYG